MNVVLKPRYIWSREVERSEELIHLAMRSSVCLPKAAGLVISPAILSGQMGFQSKGVTLKIFYPPSSLLHKILKGSLGYLLSTSYLCYFIECSHPTDKMRILFLLCKLEKMKLTDQTALPKIKRASSW